MILKKLSRIIDLLEKIKSDTAWLRKQSDPEMQMLDFFARNRRVSFEPTGKTIEWRRHKPLEEKAERKIITMDCEAIIIVENYIMEHLDKSDQDPEFETYIVWKCKTLQNWKYLISSTLNDGMYYELTYNGDKKEWYLDAYKKFENRRIASLDQ